jgi:CRP/FNR family transcriptional regulator, cyclic AMP receptor protein
VQRPFRIAAEESADLLFMPWATASDWAVVFSFAERLEVPAGLAVLQAGEEDRALYLITEGTVAVRLPRDEDVVKTIEAPAVVGELAFFDGAPRSATLEALTDVEGARLDTAAFERLTAAEPRLATAMLLDLGRVLAGRLRRASDTIRDLRA